MARTTTRKMWHLWIPAMLSIAGALAAPAGQAAAEDRPAALTEIARHGPGRLRMVEGIPFLTLEGSYREMGEQYGALLRERIAPGPSAEAAPLDREERSRVEQLSGRLRELLRGVAQGLGVSADEVLRFVIGSPAPGCSSILARTGADGASLLHAKNLDLPRGPRQELDAVVEFRPRGELRFLTTGILGFSDGMNERGITFSVDAGTTCRRAGASAPPPANSPELAGRVLDLLATAGSLAQADRLLRAEPIDAAMILAVGSAGERDGALYDLACGKVRRTGMNGASGLFATNTYVHPDLTPRGGLRECPRYRIIDDRFRRGPVATADDLVAVLSDPGTELGVNNAGTRQSAIYDAGAGTLQLAVHDGFAAWREWIAYDWRRDRATVRREALFDLGPVELRTRPAEKVASIRAVLPESDRQVAVWDELGQALGRAGAVRVAPGYTIYHRETDRQVDLEVVQPVAALAPDAGRASFRAADPVLVLSVRHSGPYATLRAAYGAIGAWASERGYVRAGPSRATWVRGSWNEPDPRRWETVIEVPVVQQGPVETPSR